MGELFDDLAQWEKGSVGAEAVTAAHPAAAELLEMHSLLTMLTTEREYGGGPGWDEVVARLDDRAPPEPEARRPPFGRVIAALLAGIVVGPATAAAARVDVLGHLSQGVTHVHAAAAGNSAAPSAPPSHLLPPPASSNLKPDATLRGGPTGRSNAPAVVGPSLSQGGGEGGGEPLPAEPLAASADLAPAEPEVTSAAAAPVHQPPAPESARGRGAAEPDAPAAPAPTEPAPGRPVEPPAGNGPAEGDQRPRGKESFAGGDHHKSHQEGGQEGHNRGRHTGDPAPAGAKQP